MIASTIGCSQVLETVNLAINTEDSSLQEEFNVVEKTLTIKEAKAHKNAPYLRKVLRNGRSGTARPILEELALSSNFPKTNKPTLYKLGVGDTIKFSKLIENNGPAIKIENQWIDQQSGSNYKLGIGDTLALTLITKTENFTTSAPSSEEDNQNLIINSKQTDGTIESTGRIGSDGSVLLLEVGRLEANGKSLNELRSEVRNILIRNGISPRFQLEIVEFKSQKAYLTINSTSTVIALDDQQTTVRDVLTSAGVGFKPGIISRIRLQRDGKEYSIFYAIFKRESSI